MKLSATDKVEIVEVANRLYECLSAHDGVEMARLFADDGQLVHAGAGQTVSPEELGTFVPEWTAGEDASMYLIGNPVFDEGDESEPTVRMNVMKYRVSVVPPEPWISAQLKMSVRRADEVWKISSFMVNSHVSCKVN
jgi:SnoaL-like domain